MSVFDHTPGKTVSLFLQMFFPVFQFVPVNLFTDSGYHWEESGFVSFTPPLCCTHSSLSMSLLYWEAQNLLPPIVCFLYMFLLEPPCASMQTFCNLLRSSYCKGHPWVWKTWSLNSPSWNVLHSQLWSRIYLRNFARLLLSFVPHRNSLHILPGIFQESLRKQHTQLTL